jgi:hypothetical protein
MPIKGRMILCTAELPPPKKPVAVFCFDFHCHGYIDQRGVWRYESDGTPIIGHVIAWAEKLEQSE